MKGYSSAGVLNDKSTWGKQERRGFLEFIDSFLSSFVKTIEFEITVPTNVYLRTKLLCEYISDKVNVHYNISEFLMTLYLDFLQTSIQKYNPRRVYEEMTRSHGYDEKLIVHAHDQIFEYKKREGTESILTISIDKKDVEKGQLLLDEIDELYGQAPSFEKMISTLWVNFIEDYKSGQNQKALNDIIRILKKNNEMTS